MYGTATQAYERAAQSVARPRELEAALLTKAAAKLSAIANHWELAETELEAALAYNRRLWTVLSTSATAPDSTLPPEMQRTISQIAVFIFARTADVLAAPQPHLLDGLVAINRNLAAGLRDQG